MTSTPDAIRTERLVAKLKELGFSFYEKTKKSTCYRRGTARVYLRDHGHQPKSVVRSVLNQAGCSREEIEHFIGMCSA
jgi:hypothetical protein